MTAESTSPTETNINEAIDWLQKTGASIQDFAVEQAPLYCREVVAWEFWSGIAFCSMGLAAIIIPLAAVYWFREWIEEDIVSYKSSGVGGIFAIMGSILSVLIGVVAIAHSAPQAIKACVAPRLIIVEHLRGLNTNQINQ